MEAGRLGTICRLFALHGGRRRLRATFWLLEAPDSLAAQSRRNPDGYGLGVFADDGSPDVDGRVSLENTHPFEQRGRLFAHNGAILDLEKLDGHLGDYRDLVAGETDSAGTIRIRSAGLAERAAVIFASEQMDEDRGWRSLEPGELVQVDTDLNVSTRVIDRAPAHQLRLEDLDPRAAASQRSPTQRREAHATP